MKESEVELLTGRLVTPKALAIVGGAMTVIEAFEVLLAPPSVEEA